MDQFVGGGGWMMMPTPNASSLIQTPSNNNNPQLESPQSLMSPHYQFQQQQQEQLQQQFQQQQLQQQQQQLQQQQQHHQSLASHFHLFHLVERLADITENGTRDQQSDILVHELTSHLEKCQQLLNSISGSINLKAMCYQTVKGQKRKLEETKQQLNQRRELISNYRSSIEELVRSDGTR